jgi:exo-1,4-beta-D-glucosaminidase
MRIFALILLSALFTSVLPAQAAPDQTRHTLEKWMIQSSAKVESKPEEISSPGFAASGWYPATVPSTVMAALVKNKVYPDPAFGMNLRSIPGTTYPIGANFSNLPMSPDSPFAAPWWYRTEFELPAETNKAVWLHFGGINYRANIWVNGKQVANLNQVAGAWRTYEFNITTVAQKGKNAVAVEVFAPQPDDLAITFVDWNPQPPDKVMGLFRKVYVATSGPVAIRHPHVITHLELPSIDAAHLTVTADLINTTAADVKGTLHGTIENAQFSQPVELGPNETKEIVFDPQQFSQLTLRNPRLWWPAQMGAQNLYTLELRFEANGATSDVARTNFGIREVTSEVSARNYRSFAINGKKILIRGGGWASDMMLRHDPARLEDEFRYVRDMHLNTIRLEGKLESDEFFHLADRYGILIMAGWCCCDHWEHWPNWKPEDYDIAKESLRDQIERLRNHPSVFVWLYGSDNAPPPDVEEMYIGVLNQCRWKNPYVSAAKNFTTPITGNNGVKMTGPYEYVVPSYWLADKEKYGGAYGFNTETSPGPAIPVVESLRDMLPKEHLWPVDDVWNYHAGGGMFKNIDVYTAALSARYGAPNALDDFVNKAQLTDYAGIRAMFEAYSRNKYTSTGVIQWMLNNAWPSVIWHLYDYYLRPGGGYFGAKKACEPLHVQYSYDDHSIALVNSQYNDVNNVRLNVKIYNIDMKEKFSKDAVVSAAADSAQKVLDLPDVEGLSTTYFLSLRAVDASGKELSRNFYWLSTKPETLNWEKSTWYYTPAASYADFTALSTLAKVKLRMSSRTERRGDEELTHVTVQNPAKELALGVHLKILKGSAGADVAPILWEDNYFPLLPGETREITATYRVRDIGAAKPVVAVDGFNVEQ